MKKETILEIPALACEGKPETSSELPFEIGEKYYIRTVTYHQTGKVKKIVGKFLILEQAAWIADSGRFMQAILEGKLDEVEPVGTCYVNTDTIIDAYPISWKLPTDQK